MGFSAVRGAGLSPADSFQYNRSPAIRQAKLRSIEDSFGEKDIYY
jgi:hypothetical protein